MGTSQQFRAKAAEYAALAKAANGLEDAQEFQKLEQSFTTLADNEQWLTDHQDQTLYAEKHEQAGEAASAGERNKP